MATRIEVYDSIDSERNYQDSLWEQGSSPQSVGEELLLIDEYVSIARREWAQESVPEINTLHVIRKIAGICVRCLEQHGVPRRIIQGGKYRKAEIRLPYIAWH